jgi:UDPglucose 6-dehydrogenase
MKITVAGVGYVGLSLAVLLAQKHEVTAITTTEAKAEKLNQFISPIQDDEIERFFREAREGSLPSIFTPLQIRPLPTVLPIS